MDKDLLKASSLHRFTGRIFCVVPNTTEHWLKYPLDVYSNCVTVVVHLHMMRQQCKLKSLQQRKATCMY